MDSLINKFKELKTFRAVGKYYGVSDKCIAKWLHKFNIPSKKSELMEYLNNI